MALNRKNGPKSVRVATLMAVATLTGCASSSSLDGERVARSGASLAGDCILGGRVRDYATLDDQNLILYGPGRRAYHVVLMRRAIGLESGFTIGVYDRDGRICHYGGDAIIVEGPLTDRIQIRSIEAIDDVDLEGLNVRFGKIEAADVEVTVTEIQ